MSPLVFGIIGLIGAILSLPFFLFFIAAGVNTYDGLLLVAAGSTFGVPAILQIIYFIKARKAYSRDPLVAEYVRGNLRASIGLKVIGGICLLACVVWTGITLWFGIANGLVVLVGIPFMAASGYFNFHSLMVASRQPVPGLDAEV